MNIDREYLKPRFTPLNMDRYIIRRAIINSLKAELPKFSGTLLDVGCGFSPYKSLILSSPSNVTNYIGLDIENNIYQKPDLSWDGKCIPLDNSSIDCVMATEVIEHCLTPQQIFDEIFRVLKPHGVFFLTTPFLWPLHDTPGDFYRYTPFSLDKLLTQAGFEALEIKPLGGWNASMAQMLGLWVRRRPANIILRFLSVLLLYPCWIGLFLSDKQSSDFDYNSIFCGLTATAKKSGDHISEKS